MYWLDFVAVRGELNVDVALRSGDCTVYLNQVEIDKPQYG